VARFLLAAALALLASFHSPRAAAQGLPSADAATSGRRLGSLPAVQCESAVRSAETRYALPAGLLAAISRAETERPDPVTGAPVPWPWSVQAEGRGMFFDSKEQAVQWVRDARARGVTSIDTGCLQVNLAYHPNAFATLEEAFDPRRNADYAARFLVQLHAATGDWRLATGAYHSQSQALAGPYVARVQTILGPRPISALKPARPRLIDVLAEAWRATGSGSDPAASGESGEAPPAGRGWDTLLRPQAARVPRPSVAMRPVPPAMPMRLTAADPTQ